MKYGLQVLLEKKKEIEDLLKNGHHLPQHIEQYEQELKQLDVAIKFLKSNLK